MCDWLHDILEVVINERLLIRQHQAGDGAAYFQAVVESLDNLRRWPTSSRHWRMVHNRTSTHGLP